MAYRIIKTVLAACLLAPVLVNAAEPMERDGGWDLVYDDKSCDLTGIFGGKSDSVAVRLRQFQPGDVFDLSLIGRRFVFTGPQPQEAEIDFGPTANPRSSRILMGRTGRLGVMMLGSRALDDREMSLESADEPPMTAAAVAAVDWLKVSYRGRSLAFNLGSMAKPMAALRKCTDDLVRAWGYDPSQQTALSQRAKPLTKPETWLRSSDYPRVMEELGRGSQIVFRLHVDAAGGVAGCHILSQLTDQEFARVTCNNIKNRARFSPGEDAKGVRVGSYYVGMVRWMIETP